MDEFFIHHLDMTHPPIWLLWVCIFYVIGKFLLRLGAWANYYQEGTWKKPRN